MDPTRRRFRQTVFKRFLVRAHWLIILGLTLGAAVALNRLFLTLGFQHLVWRSLVNCGATYLVFLGLVRLWVVLVQSAEPRLASLSPGEAALAAPRAPDDTTHDGETFGASADVVQTVAEVGGGLLEGELFAAIVGGVMLAVAGLALVVAILPWFWFEVPALLAEVAFQVALGASLVRRVGRLERAAIGPGWLSVLVVGTLKPLAFVVGVTLLVTLIAYAACDRPARLTGCFVEASAPP